MSEIEQLAAEYNISIVDSQANGEQPQRHSKLSGDSGTTSATVVNALGDHNPIQALEEEFQSRYTDDDPEYTKTVKEAEMWSKPPCVQDFFVRRPRDDSRNWSRHRDQGRDGHYHRGGRGGGRDGGGDWDRRDYRDGRDYRDRSYDRRGWAGGDNQHRYRGGYSGRDSHHNSNGYYGSR